MLSNYDPRGTKPGRGISHSYRRKVERWQEFEVAATAAKVFTTDTEVQAAADAARDAPLTLERACDDWYYRQGDGDRESRVTAFRSGSRACENARAELASKIESSLDLR